MHGSLSVARQLLGAGLVDRVRLARLPERCRPGQATVSPDAPVALELVSAVPFDNGVVAMEYKPVVKG